MELWDILDENAQPTGRLMDRRGRLGRGEFHLVVHTWVDNGHGLYLIQRRSTRLGFCPGMWAPAGGSAKAGEDSITAARRELFEELGVSSAQENFRFLGRQRRNHAFRDLWQLTISCCTELKLQPEEVDSAAWKSRCEIMDMVERGEFINYGAEYFDMVFSGQEDDRDDCCR